MTTLKKIVIVLLLLSALGCKCHPGVQSDYVRSANSIRFNFFFQFVINLIFGVRRI